MLSVGLFLLMDFSLNYKSNFLFLHLFSTSFNFILCMRDAFVGTLDYVVFPPPPPQSVLSLFASQINSWQSFSTLWNHHFSLCQDVSYYFSPLNLG